MLLLLALLQGNDGAVYDGRLKQTDVHIPRVEATATIDGVLGEPRLVRVAPLIQLVLEATCKVEGS